MINIDKITFSYDNSKKVLDEFSLFIKENDRICLFGESGCGKTTLLRILMGLETPQSGTISGKNRLVPAVVFQEDRLLPFKTVLQNVTFIGADIETATLHLKALGLAGQEEKYPSALSGGMRRRAAIARALSSEFDYLLLDEPFNGLDEENVITAVSHILKTLEGRPLVMVTHSKEHAKLLDARIVNMKKE